VYLNDILICSPSLSEHENKLHQVFNRLSTAGLTIQPSKCQFFKSKLEFLGHTLSSKGIAPNDSKVKAIADFPTPKNQKELRSFLGLSGFYRPFIQDYRSIATPLNHLLKKDSIWQWTDEEKATFTTLKSQLIKAPLLAFPDFSLPFVLTTDASNLGLGAVLHQKHGHSGKTQPIAFASRALNSAEKRYHTTDRELLSITWALRHFRELILGYQIEVHTDHSPLTSIFKGRDPHGRRARAIEVLAEFDVTIVYLPRKQNVADTLSCAPLSDAHNLLESSSSPTFASRKMKFSDIAPILVNTAAPTVEDPSEDEIRPAHVNGRRSDPIHSVTSPVLAAPAVPPMDPPTEDEIRLVQRNDNLYGPLIQALERNEIPPPSRHVRVSQLYLDANGLLCYKSRFRTRKLKASRKLVVIPESLEGRILPLFHESKEAAHCGKYKAIHLDQQRFFFPHLISKVAEHVQSCKQCPYYKGNTSDPATAL